MKKCPVYWSVNVVRIIYGYMSYEILKVYEDDIEYDGNKDWIERD